MSKKTGNVATKRDIKSPFSGNPKWRNNHSKNTSHPRGEWNPTNKSVPKINKKDFVVSLKLYKDSDKNDFKIII